MLARTSLVALLSAVNVYGELSCPDGEVLPPLNLQLIHLHDMGAGQLVMEYRNELGLMMTSVEEAFGATTQTALTTFVDKPYSQHEIENTWCYKKEFGFAPAPNGAAFDATMNAYGTFLGQDYNMGDSQLDPIYIATRRANEFAWDSASFGNNGKANFRVFSIATNQHPLNAGNYTENSSKPNWSDDAHEDCATVNYPSVEQMKSAVSNLGAYFVFLVDSGESSYGDLVLNYYNSIPNSVTVDLATVGTPEGRSSVSQALVDALKALFCGVVTWPVPCIVPSTLVPTDQCPCSCKVMAEIKEKFDTNCGWDL